MHAYIPWTYDMRTADGDEMLDEGRSLPRGKRAGLRRHRRQRAKQLLQPRTTLRRGPYGKVCRSQTDACPAALLTVCLAALPCGAVQFRVHNSCGPKIRVGCGA